MIFFTSDTHFSHENIIQYCKRPFGTSHEMNKRLTENWNNVVLREDMVFHLGDFAHPRCKDPTPYLSGINGTVFLIAGNHDKRGVLDAMPFCAPYVRMRIGQFSCLLIHRPVYPRKMRKDPFNKHKDHVTLTGKRESAEQYDFVLSGHIHNSYEVRDGKPVGRLWNGKSLNLSTDMHNYTPVCLEDVEHMLGERFEQTKDKLTCREGRFDPMIVVGNYRVEEKDD